MSKWMSALVAISVGLTAVGCDSNNDKPLQVTHVSDVPADPAGHDPNTGAPIGATGRYTFFDLSSNEIILDRENDDRSDSTSNNWDLAFQSTNIIVNSSATGGGQGGVQVLNQDFDTVTQAPSSGYVTDKIGLEPASPAWGTYEAALMLVFPRENKTLVIKTADGKYAKVRILSYYKGAPEVPEITDESRYYTFDFVYQPDGSRDFPE